MFSPPSYSEWEYIGKSVKGIEYYVDFERIRKHDGYVFYWELKDYVTENEQKKHQGFKSAIGYIKGDCNIFRYKRLMLSFREGPMGMGDSFDLDYSEKEDPWHYQHPKSIGESVQNSVCSR